MPISKLSPSVSPIVPPGRRTDAGSQIRPVCIEGRTPAGHSLVAMPGSTRRTAGLPFSAELDDPRAEVCQGACALRQAGSQRQRHSRPWPSK